MSAANDVYQEKQATVRRLLAELGVLAEAHSREQAAQPLDWGYVGDLAHAEERLKEIVGFLRPVEVTGD